MPRRRAILEPARCLALDAASAIWSEGLALERERVVRGFEPALRPRSRPAHPESAFLAWRIARNYWRQGERLAAAAKDERRAAFTRSLEWAQRSLERDPTAASACSGRWCRGAGSPPRQAWSRPRAWRADGRADRPRHRAPSRPRATTSGTNARQHLLAASAFYRVVPDWPLVDLAIGVRGNKERALDYIERAVAISPMRIDYQVEHGVVLTCIGVERGDAAVLARGTRGAPARAHDAAPARHGRASIRRMRRLLLERPELACGYSRDGFIDLSGVEARRSAVTRDSNLRRSLLLALVSTLVILALLEGAARVVCTCARAAAPRRDGSRRRSAAARGAGRVPDLPVRRVDGRGRSARRVLVRAPARVLARAARAAARVADRQLRLARQADRVSRCSNSSARSSASRSRDRAHRAQRVPGLEARPARASGCGASCAAGSTPPPPRACCARCVRRGRARAPRVRCRAHAARAHRAVRPHEPERSPRASRSSSARRARSRRSRASAACR